jgi:hypothetical protein
MMVSTTFCASRCLLKIIRFPRSPRTSRYDLFSRTGAWSEHRKSFYQMIACSTLALRVRSFPFRTSLAVSFCSSWMARQLTSTTAWLQLRSLPLVLALSTKRKRSPVVAVWPICSSFPYMESRVAAKDPR